MRDYVMLGVMERDMAMPLPTWMRRVQVWAADDKFSVHCGCVPLEEATQLVVEALLYVLKRRGRDAEPIHNDANEVCGLRW